MTNLDEIERLLTAGTSEYIAWLRSILTLSSGGLTLLVALQGQFVPQSPRLILLLQFSWILLAVSVLLSLFGVAGLHRLYFAAVVKLVLEESRNQGTEAGDRRAPPIPMPEPYRSCGRIAPWAFVLAILSLCAFGIANLPRQSPASTPASGKQKAASADRVLQETPSTSHLVTANPPLKRTRQTTARRIVAR